MRRFIRTLSDEYIAISDGGIYENVIALPEYQNAKSVLLYYSTGREPYTRSLIKRSLADGKITALPVSYPHGVMVARRIESLELSEDMYGIPAPSEDCPEIKKWDIDLVIVPGVTFARNGYRLGQGGGYYDRYLSDYTGNTVGLVRCETLLDKVPKRKYDLAVKCIVSESGVIRPEPAK